MELGYFFIFSFTCRDFFNDFGNPYSSICPATLEGTTNRAEKFPLSNFDPRMIISTLFLMIARCFNGFIVLLLPS